MKLTQKDVLEAESHALQYLLHKAPGGKLPGMTKDLSERERILLAHIHGTIVMLRKLGLLEADSPALDLIDVEHDDGELATEGFDSAASNS